jgi:hypothetical protein
VLVVVTSALNLVVAVVKTWKDNDRRCHALFAVMERMAKSLVVLVRQHLSLAPFADDYSASRVYMVHQEIRKITLHSLCYKRPWAVLLLPFFSAGQSMLHMKTRAFLVSDAVKAPVGIISQETIY